MTHKRQQDKSRIFSLHDIPFERLSPTLFSQFISPVRPIFSLSPSFLPLLNVHIFPRPVLPLLVTLSYLYLLPSFPPYFPQLLYVYILCSFLSPYSSNGRTQFQPPPPRPYLVCGRRYLRIPVFNQCEKLTGCFTHIHISYMLHIRGRIKKYRKTRFRVEE
jgi:hypothetical protein